MNCKICLDCFNPGPASKSASFLASHRLDEQHQTQDGDGDVGRQNRGAGVVLGKPLAEEQAEQGQQRQFNPGDGEAAARAEQEEDEADGAAQAGDGFQGSDDPEHSGHHVA